MRHIQHLRSGSGVRARVRVWVRVRDAGVGSPTPMHLLRGVSQDAPMACSLQILGFGLVLG